MKKEALIDREHRILANLEKAIESADHHSITRIVWRIGEIGIRNAVPQLHKLIGQSNDLANYCVAWTLGRIKDPASFKELKNLFSKTSSESVRRIAYESMLATTDEARRVKLLAEIKNRTIHYFGIEKLDQESLKAAVGQLVTVEDAKLSDWLYDLYLVAMVDPVVKQVLLDVVRSIPIRANYFKAIRHIYKASELRLDSEMFALITYRIETTPSLYSRFAWEFEYIRLAGSEDYVQLDQEISKKDSRIAYSANTRDYLRRRACRVLRHFGELEHPSYVDFAMQVLLQYTDNIDNKLSAKNQSKEIQQDKNYGLNASHLCFNQILHQFSDEFQLTQSGRAWKRIGSDHGASPVDLHAIKRTEAFPALWDKEPGFLLQLVQQSESALVQQFAARALLDNTEYCSKIPIKELQRLLCSRFRYTAQLGFEIVKSSYPGKNKNESIIAVLRSSSDLARKHGQKWLDDSQDSLTTDSHLLVSLLTNPYPEIRQWGMGLIKKIRFENEYVIEVIKDLFVYIQGQEKQSEQIDAVVSDLGKILNGVFSEHVKRLEIRIVADLLQHPLTCVQAIGGQIILGHGVSAEFLPVKIFCSLMESESDVARNVGIQLFKTLPDPPLLRQPEMIASFCLSEHANIKEIARSRIKLLANSNASFGKQIVGQLTPYLLKTERQIGFHQEIVELIKNELNIAAHASEITAIWHLLFSRSSDARQFGAFLLSSRSTSEVKVEQWATLADHEIESVRQWALGAYGQNPEEIKAKPAAAIAILNSRWESSRKYAMGFFLKYFSAKQWTPELLVTICDTAQEDIQCFAHELMLEFFQQGQGVEYLMKLSQHPSLQTKMFVSRFLSSFASDNHHRLQTLSKYFIEVLCMVNKGGAVKSMVLRFLQEEGLKSADSAQVIAPILNRQSLTSVTKYKSIILEIMTEFSLMYPEIELPITIKTQAL